ncbi:PD-(D/E)XK nuclease family transposase [Desulfobotulus mexicanus]
MEIKIYNDIVFKWIFGRQSCTAPLIALLNAITSPSKKFSEVTILNPFDESEPFKNEKQGILDIRAKDDCSGKSGLPLSAPQQILPCGHVPGSA